MLAAIFDVDRHQKLGLRVRKPAPPTRRRRAAVDCLCAGAPRGRERRSRIESGSAWDRACAASAGERCGGSARSASWWMRPSPNRADATDRKIPIALPRSRARRRAAFLARAPFHRFDHQARQPRMQRIARHAARPVAGRAQSFEQLFGASDGSLGRRVEPGQRARMFDAHGAQREA